MEKRYKTKYPIVNIKILYNNFYNSKRKMRKYIYKKKKKKKLKKKT